MHALECEGTFEYSHDGHPDGQAATPVATVRCRVSVRTALESIPPRVLVDRDRHSSGVGVVPCGTTASHTLDWPNRAPASLRLCVLDG
jgi:hypothetical protein